MAGVIITRKNPKLDMNPMVDMAFLLVSFFMMTTTFKTEEPVTIERPGSQSELKLPQTNLVLITMSEQGGIFFGVDSKNSRYRLLDLMGKRYEIQFTEKEKDEFSLVNNFGLPVSGLKSYLSYIPSERKELEQPGIPFDSAQNELLDWIIFARVANPRTRFAINADKDTPYEKVKALIDLLQDNKITRFNLITNLEGKEEIDAI